LTAASKGKIDAFLAAEPVGKARIQEGVRLRELPEVAFTYYPSGFVDKSSGLSAKAFVAKLAVAPRVSESWTSISSAIIYCAVLFKDNGFDGKRRVIDVSGDGRNNAGPDMAMAREEVLARGITINGLPIMSDRPNFGRPPDTELDIYYEREVIGGPGAFSVVARDFSDFARAIRTKLIKEISQRDPDSGVAAR